jgi:hypothetical protein
MPPEEAGYTYAVEPTANNRLLANEEESIYRRSDLIVQRRYTTRLGLSINPSMFAQLSRSSPL